jgi:origin recognition complex subunit 2
VNFPLLWPKRASAALRWAWEHAPTYAPYGEETAAVPQILAQRGEARLTRGAANVLRILTPNARAIFRVLAEETLAHPADHGAARRFACHA